LIEQIRAYFDDADRQQGAVDIGAVRRGVEEGELIMVEVSDVDGRPPEAPIGGRRWPVIAAAAVVLVVVAALVVSFRRESSDGQRAGTPPVANGLIAFVGASADNPGKTDMYVVAGDGTGLRPLTSTPELTEYSPEWSPGGTRLAFLRTSDDEFWLRDLPCAADCQLIVVDPSTGAETFSADVKESGLVPQSLAWSPDGRAIEITSAPCGSGGCGPGSSRIVDLGTGSVTTFTPPSVARWSPDGQWLALFDGSDRGPSLVLVPADLVPTGGVVDVGRLADARALPAPAGLDGAGWIPNGSALLGTFGMWSSADQRWIEVAIDVVSVANGERRTLIEDAFDPVVSPDGTWIAYSRGDTPSGVWEIWVSAVDGSDPRRVTTSSTPPAWSPDGTLLLASDQQGWFTVRPDGTDRAALGIRDHTPPFRGYDGTGFWPGFIASGIAWQPLPADRRVTTERSLPPRPSDPTQPAPAPASTNPQVAEEAVVSAVDWPTLLAPPTDLEGVAVSEAAQGRSTAGFVQGAVRTAHGEIIGLTVHGPPTVGGFGIGGVVTIGGHDVFVGKGAGDVQLAYSVSEGCYEVTVTTSDGLESPNPRPGYPLPDVREFFEHLRVTDGIVTVQVPAGWESLGAAAISDRYTLHFIADGASVGAPATLLEFQLDQRPDTGVGVFLADPRSTNPRPTTVSGRPAWLITGPGQWTNVAFDDDGTAVSLRGRGVTEEQLVAFAAMLVPRPWQETAALLDGTNPTPPLVEEQLPERLEPLPAGCDVSLELP
jgi:Tol biopolymer transport system component